MIFVINLKKTIKLRIVQKSITIQHLSSKNGYKNVPANNLARLTSRSLSIDLKKIKNIATATWITRKHTSSIVVTWRMRLSKIEKLLYMLVLQV